MTVSTQSFVRKHTTQYLPIKYVRLSMLSFVQREHIIPQKPTTSIGPFIETPIHRLSGVHW